MFGLPPLWSRPIAGVVMAAAAGATIIACSSPFASSGAGSGSVPAEEVSDQSNAGEDSWYNHYGFRSVFGDFNKTEPLFIPDQATAEELLARGRYLAVGPAACGSCHGQDAADPGSPLSGGRLMTDRFGQVRAPNITSDKETGIGSWNVSEIGRAIRASIDREGRPLSIDLHAGYRWLSDRDVKAIATYLLASPPASNPVERRSG